MLRAKYLERLRSRQMGISMDTLETEEAFLLPILSEIQQEGDDDQTYLMLCELFSTYCRHGEYEKARSTLAQMDLLTVEADNGCAPLVAQRLYLLNIFPDLVMSYIRRGYLCIQQLTGKRQRHWELSLLKTLELAVLSKSEPHSEQIVTLLEEVNSLRRGVRQYTDFLLTALQNLIIMGIFSSHTRPLLLGARSSLKNMVRSGATSASYGEHQLSLINELLSKIPS